MRIETTTRTLYKFGELTSDRAKERARDWWRQVNQEDTFWSDYVTGDFEEVLPLLGFELGYARGSRTRRAVYWRLNPDEAGFCASWSADMVEDDKAALLLVDRPATYTDADGKTQTCKANATLAGIVTRVLALRAAWPFSTGTAGGGRDGTTQSGELDTNDGETDTGMNDDPAGEFESICGELAQWLAVYVSDEWESVNSAEYIDQVLTDNDYEFTEDGDHA